MKKALVYLAALTCLAACATTDDKSLSESITALELATHSKIDIDATLSTAQTAFEKENYKSSVELYHRIILREPDHISAGLGYADSALALGLVDKANQHLSEMRNLELSDDALQQVNAGLALAEILTSDPEHRMARIEAALKQHANDPRFWNAKGLVHDGRQEWLPALDAYIEALKTGKPYSGIVNNMGMSLLNQGRYDEAKTKFEHALEIKPDSRLYDNNRRLALFLNNNIRLGLKDIPDDRAASLLSDAGFMAMQQERPALAKMLLRHAVKIAPSYHAKAVENLELLKAKQAPATSPG